MSIEEKRDQLVEELVPFEDHLDRFAYVIDRAKDAPGLKDEYKIETFLIKGCISQLWVFPKFENGTCYFQADSDGRNHPAPFSQPQERSHRGTGKNQELCPALPGQRQIV